MKQVSFQDTPGLLEKKSLVSSRTKHSMQVITCASFYTNKTIQIFNFLPGDLFKYIRKVADTYVWFTTF